VSTKQKALDKMRQNPQHVRFADIDKILTWYGFTQRQSRHGTSHYVYVPSPAAMELPGVNNLPVPYKRPFVRQTYVKQMLAMLELIDDAGLGPQE
jgi:hypothetical protein